jgi:IMP dehydrogenase
MGEQRTLKEFGEIKVSEVMVPSHKVITTTPDEKISTTEILMLKKKVGGLPVVNDNARRQVTGIITQRDIRLSRFAISLDSPLTTVKDLMTAEPYVVKQDNTIKEALEIMFSNKIERLPVVNDDNVLIGLVGEQRILRKLYEHLLE